VKVTDAETAAGVKLDNRTDLPKDGLTFAIGHVAHGAKINVPGNGM
jgi:hypothetical protein